MLMAVTVPGGAPITAKQGPMCRRLRVCATSSGLGLPMTSGSPIENR